MFLTSSILAPMQRRQLAPSKSWVGVDIGRSALKLAEVEQVDGFWKIIQMQYAPICQSGVWSSRHLAGSVLANELSQLVALTPGWKHRQAAAILSLSAADYRIMNLPNSSVDEYEEMIYQELVTEYQEDVIFEYWEPEEELSDTNDEITSLMVYSVAHSNANAVGTGLERAKLNCRVLDGLPFALSRAIVMADPAARHRSTIALDWGYSSVVLLFLKDGIPFYTRLLRGCQFQVFLEMLGKEFDLDERQSWNLLRSTLAHQESSGEFRSALNKRLKPIVEDYLKMVSKEVTRTIQYIEANTRIARSEHVWAFGGGALFRQLTEPLAETLQIPVRPWELRLAEKLDSPLHRDLVPLFGPAAALASLKRWQ